MRCNACHGPVAFERTVFRGTQPTTIRLCMPCAEKVDVRSHLEQIKGAPDHARKEAAVASFLSAIEDVTAASSGPGA
jgi:hypothetical protein